VSERLTFFYPSIDFFRAASIDVSCSREPFRACSYESVCFAFVSLAHQCFLFFGSCSFLHRLYLESWTLLFGPTYSVFPPMGGPLTWLVIDDLRGGCLRVSM
jgi:hypothetical protein